MLTEGNEHWALPAVGRQALGYSLMQCVCAFTPLNSVCKPSHKVLWVLHQAYNGPLGIQKFQLKGHYVFSDKFGGKFKALPPRICMYSMPGQVGPPFFANDNVGFPVKASQC